LRRSELEFTVPSRVGFDRTDSRGVERVGEWHASAKHPSGAMIAIDPGFEIHEYKHRERKAVHGCIWHVGANGNETGVAV
jgi:hypothetical protein